MVALVATRVIRTVKLLTMGADGPTFGQSVDLHIAEALAQGETLQTIAIEFGDGEWNALQEASGGNRAKRGPR